MEKKWHKNMTKEERQKAIDIMNATTQTIYDNDPKEKRRLDIIYEDLINSYKEKYGVKVNI